MSADTDGRFFVAIKIGRHGQCALAHPLAVAGEQPAGTAVWIVPHCPAVMTTIPKFRGFLYALAKILGDARAVKTGRIGRRIARRLAGKVTRRGLGRLFPILVMIALAACSATADGRPSTFGENLELAATKYGARVQELIQPEILGLPIMTYKDLEPPVCVYTPELYTDLLLGLCAVPLARATFTDGTILSLQADASDPGAIVVYVFGLEEAQACMLAIGVTGALP